MRMRKKGYCVSILLCMLLGLTSCSNKGGAEQETPYYSVNIDGIKQYIPEDDEAVQKLKELGLGYVDLTCNIDYKSTERAMEELDYYAKDFRAEYEEYGYVESGVETIEYYEQVMQLNETSIPEIRFFEYADTERAWVACEYIATVTNATDEYLTDVGIKLNTKYKRTMTLGFVKEDGEWKISEYDITEREEVQ